MKKLKYFMMFLFVTLLLCIVPNVSNAAVEYTRTIGANDGSITLHLTGVTLDESKAYSFSLVTKGSTPSTWHRITEYTSTTAQVSLSAATTDIVKVLRVADTGILYVKDDSDDSYVIDGLTINLKLPYLQAINYEDLSGRYLIRTTYSEIGGTSKSYYQFQKVTDENLIKQFLNIKNNKGDITELENMLPSVPTTGYYKEDMPSYSKYKDGLYLMWVKITGNNCKDIYGCVVHDGLPEATTLSQYISGTDVEAPTVSSIKVISPTKDGVYSAGQVVKITVTFSENITGTVVPTLKIRFGTSKERTITNGTISGKTIVYTYQIAKDDVGQLAVTGYSGGTIQDASGNSAKITPKTIGGYTIKANVSTGNVNNNNNGSSNNTQNNDGSHNKDNTIASGTIPQTGVGIGIIVSILTVTVIGIFIYRRYQDLKDIK